MNNCCPSYATKALHLANEQSWMIENPNRPVYMCFAIIKCGYFSPEVKKPQSSLYWDYIPFFVVCNYQKTSSSSTSNRMKEAKTEGKRWPNLVFVPTGQKYEAQTPGKNLEGRPICSLHKKCQFLAPANEIRMRYLIPRQRNYQLWLTRWRLLPWPLHNTVFLHDTELKLSEVFFYDISPL